MSIIKYLDEQGPEHGEAPLSWPGMYGVPVRGNPGMMLKDEELDEFIESALDFHCKEFDLSDAAQKDEYTKVMDRICNGWYVEKFVDRYRDEQTGGWKVYLEWCQAYNQINPHAAARIGLSNARARTG